MTREYKLFVADVIKKRLPQLKPKIEQILKDLESENDNVR
jgi:uncharacterized protein with HEPN domain